MKYSASTASNEKKPRNSYGNISPQLCEDIASKVILKLVIEKKYRDPNYSAQQLASELATSVRNLSAIIGLRFQLNYAKLVGWLRISEAKYLLQNAHFATMTMEDIAVKVGFTTRQNFYATFYKQSGMTPKQYRALFASATNPTEKKNKK